MLRMYFRAFNFRTSQAVRKYFNNEILAIYGIYLRTGQAMAETALKKIKHRFSHLVLDVQSSMEKHKVQVKIVRRFVLVFCDGNCSIPKDNDLDTIFDAITEARLWRYDHYGLLEVLAEEFLPEDDPARVQLD